MTLTQKISFTIFFTAILTAVVLGFFVFRTTKSGLEKAIGDTQLEVTRQTMDKIDRLLYERFLDITAIAANDSLESFLMGGGRIAKEDLAREFHENTILTGPWDFLYAVNNDRVVVVSTNKNEVGKFVAEHEQRKIAVTQALEGKVYYSDLVISDTTNKPVIIFAAPVRSRELGRPIIGVVIGNFSWAVVLEILEQLAEQTRLYNAAGFLIGSSDPDESNYDFLRDDHRASVVESALQEREKSGIFPSLNENFSILASHVRQLGYLNYKGSGWRLIIETPTEVAFTPAFREARDLALVSVVISIFSALIIFTIINRNVVRPVTVLTQTASIIAQGELTRRAQIFSKDEIGRLAESFNEMADSLLEALKLPESIIHSIGDGLIVFDEEGKVELMNPQAEKIFALGKSQVVGNEIDKLTSLPLFRSLIELLGEKPETVFRKEFHIRDDMIMEVTAVSVELGKERKRFMIVLHDITREKQIDRLKSEFVSIAAHQLRTPLTAINWALEKMTREQGSADHEFLTKTYEQSRKMTATVHDLLDAARIEGMGLSYQFVQLDLVPVINNAIAVHAKMANVKHINVTFNHTTPSLTLKGDPQKLDVVISNLLTNAIEYTPEGGSVTVEAHADRKVIQLIVRDTGVGIDANDIARIFTKFFRGSRAITMHPDGLGIGLFISKNIIEAHHGTITLESNVGQDRGTSFSIRLPRT